MSVSSDRTMKARLRRAIQWVQAQRTSRVSALAAYDALHTKGADVASATTIDLTDAGGAMVDITGTATISAITQQPAGIVRRVRFLGAATLVYSSSLILPTAGTNITTALNDQAEFRSQGSGNWTCSQYMLADGTILGVVPIVKGGTGEITAIDAKDALTTESTDIASASTTDMSTATGEAVRVTGTVTITNLGSVTAGARRLVTFADSLTLTHDGTNLILPTEANIQTAEGDVAEFVSLGE